MFHLYPLFDYIQYIYIYILEYVNNYIYNKYLYIE